MIIQRDLESDVYPYIRETLSYGFALEQRLLTLPLEQGRAYTYLPDHVDGLPLHDFKTWGFWSPYHWTDAENIVESDIKRYLQKEEGIYKYVLVEEVMWPTSTDNIFEECTSVAYYHDEIYYYLTDADTEEYIEKVIDMGQNWRGVGVCFHSSQPLDLHHGKPIPEPVFDTARDNLDILLIGAYDEEGWILWTPSTNNRQP